MKILKKYWRWIAIGVLVLGRIILGGGKPAKVETTTVVRGNLTQFVSTSGTVKADHFATLTFQTGGKLVWVGVKPGDKVWKSQAIAKLDTVPLNAAYQQALNNYRNAQATAESTLDSVKGHDRDENFSQKAARTAAEVARDNAYEALKIAESNLRNATLYAPFNGIVASANPVFAGINVTPVSASYVIFGPETTYIDSEVEETDLPNVKVDQNVKIILDAYPGEELEGKVETIGVVAFTSSTGGNAYSVRVSLPANRDLKFRYGMQGDIEIVFGVVENVLKVQSTALVSDGGKDYVWIVEGNRLKKVGVELGTSSYEETEIKSGLEEGQVVINTPAASLKIGQKVKI